MLDFHLPATQLTPEVLICPLRGLFTLRGESYPENVLSFYAPVLEQLRSVLEDGKLPLLKVEMHITYYNSASAKAIHRIFQLLDRAAEQGCAVKVTWQYDEEDDMARDLGRDLREDFHTVEIVDVPMTAV